MDQVNQTLEQYLRIFTTFNQDNRSELLWLARGLSITVLEYRRSYLNLGAGGNCGNSVRHYQVYTSVGQQQYSSRIDSISVKIYHIKND